MPEFLRLATPEEAWTRFMSELEGEAYPRSSERVPTGSALDRVLAEAVTAEEPLPPFRRSTVDGFALKAVDTHGASAALPQYLSLVGEILMGEVASIEVDTGQAATIHTGGMLPAGTDAVVMVEDTQTSREGEIEVLKPVAIGENVLAQGEDLEIGEVAIAKGRRLRAQELAGLMALGRTEVEVAVKPRIAILSTGDELVEPAVTPGPGEIRDINSTSLSALVTRAGGAAVPFGIIPDSEREILRVAREAWESCEVVLISAGSSVSVRDLTARIVGQLGKPGVLVHGISFKPGKPTILGVSRGTPVIGLPGNPVSALVVAELFLVPLIGLLLGEDRAAPIGQVTARMSVNVASESGREDHLAVRLERSGEEWVAHPVYGRSNLIFTLIRADGIVRIPPQATGLDEGAWVSVRLF